MKALESIFALPIFQSLGWALLHFVWQGTAVAGLLAGVRVFLRERTANARYVVACAALALMLLLPVATVWLANFSSPESVDVTVNAHRAAGITEIPESDAFSIVQSEQSRLNQSRVQASSWQERVMEQLESFLPQLILVWLTGVLLLSVRLCGGALQTRRLKRSATRAVEEKWQAVCEALSKKMGVKQAVRLLESQLARVPTVIGWLRPVILLPTSVFVGLTPQQLQSILAHELAHIRRHDYLINILQITVETILFYHPAVWWVSRQIRIEREHACDDIAVALCGDALVYARALTRLERLRKGQPQMLVAANGGGLMERILRLVGDSSPRFGRFGKSLAGLVVISSLLAIALGTQLTPVFKQVVYAQANDGASELFNESSNIERRDATSASIVAGQDDAEIARGLKSANPNERAAAACAAGKAGAAAAIPSLISMLGDDADIKPLRCWQTGSWSPALETFKSPSPGEEAAIALAAIGKAAVGPLVAVLNNTDASVRRNAAWAIGEIRGGHAVNRAAAVETLITLLGQDGDGWVRKAAAFTLGELRDARAGEPLINALRDVNEDVRQSAAWALGEMKDERAVKALSAALLEDASASVRTEAAGALGEIQDPNATEALTLALNDREQPVRDKARWALAEIQDQ